MMKYDKYPSIKSKGLLVQEWNSILDYLEKELPRENSVIAVDCYLGVLTGELIHHFSTLEHELFLQSDLLFKPEQEIRQLTDSRMTEDVLFGCMTGLTFNDYIEHDKVMNVRTNINTVKGRTIILGHGASLIAEKTDVIIYVDMARWEIQQRFRRNEISNLGIKNREESVSLQYKRGYFNDWGICDKHKRDLFDRVDFWLDTHIPGTPKLITKETFYNGIHKAISSPFRVVPFFDPAPWGGQWMKATCDLERDTPNYGWCFDCVPEENSLLLDVNGTIFEMPSMNLVYLKSRELLGAPVEARFGADFPIRFDFLDTVAGGNLSLQVHPTTQYAHDHFGIHYTQDESYYLLDTGVDATVYLGLKSGVNKDDFIKELRASCESGRVLDVEKYINKLPAKKHDHFLIPAGTIHCSGANALVLEISSTPNIFTFKLWDWQRLGLDGKPRPINVERGIQVIDWERDTQFVENELVGRVEEIARGEGWREERTGLHKNEFIETRRHWFSKPVTHYTCDSVNVLNLIEGEEAIVESPGGHFEPYLVHYAETFIVPAAVGCYTIRPYGNSEGKECATIKAFVRF